jgi:hypothetical protein
MAPLPLRRHIALRRHMTMLVASLAVLWSSARAGEVDADLDARIDSILQRPEPQRCLPLGGYESVEILERRHLLFHGLSKELLWLNRLGSGCAELKPGMTLEFDTQGDQVCAGDTVQGIERRFHFWEDMTASCALGEFEPVTEGQAQAVKEAIGGS